MALDNVSMVKAITGETDEAVINVYLDIAGQKIIARAYPFRGDVSDVPDKYKTLQCEIAAYMLNKRGAEGQTGHSENGINRTYENADVPASMMSIIVPECGVIST